MTAVARIGDEYEAVCHHHECLVAGDGGQIGASNFLKSARVRWGQRSIRQKGINFAAVLENCAYHLDQVGPNGYIR